MKNKDNTYGAEYLAAPLERMPELDREAFAEESKPGSILPTVPAAIRRLAMALELGNEAWKDDAELAIRDALAMAELSARRVLSYKVEGSSFACVDSRTDAEDIASEAVAEAFVALGKLEIQSLHHFIRSAQHRAKNIARNANRTRAIHARHGMRLGSEFETKSDARAYRDADREAFLVDSQASLEALSKLQGAVARAYFVEGDRIKADSLMSNAGIQSLRSRQRFVQQVREQLAARLADYAPEPEPETKEPRTLLCNRDASKDARTSAQFDRFLVSSIGPRRKGGRTK